MEIQKAWKFPKLPDVEGGTVSHFQQIKNKSEIAFENKGYFNLISFARTKIESWT